MSSNIDVAIPPFGSPTTAGVRANFAAAKEEIEALQNAVGYCNANHGGGTQAITADTWTQLLNDATGALCQSYLPSSIATLWDATTNAFTFAQVPVHSMLEIRLDIELTTTAVNQTADIAIDFGIGSPSEFRLSWAPQMLFRDTGSRTVVTYNGFYIGSTDIQESPAHVMFRTSDAATVQVNSWYSRIIIPIFEL